MNERLTRLLNSLIQYIVTDKQSVKVVAMPLAVETLVKIEVNPAENGRVIGERGAHFKALEKLCLLASAKAGKAFKLLPMDEADEDVVPMQYGRFRGNDNWPKQSITELVEHVARVIFHNEDVIEVDVEDQTNFVSVFTVRVARTEPADVVFVAIEAYAPLFNAIGRVDGRVLSIQVIAEKSPGRRQPLTTDGRHCKTIRR